MGDEWFRGEGVNVTPAPPGTVDNDIGDGMYLSDKIEVAQQYAVQRAPNPKDQRVYKLSLNWTGIRVLDLTTDARWKKHISFPMPGGTIEAQLRSGTASQYAKHFKNFLEANKIDLNHYDAVIGYEYRSGGRQMCILYKNGNPSTIQIKLRTLFVPVGGQVVTKTPRGLLRFNGRIGTGLKFAGGTVAVAVVTYLLNWVLGGLIEKQQQEDLQRQHNAMASRIENIARTKILDALKLIAEGKRAFAVIRISINTTSMHMGEFAGWAESAPSVEYLGMEIKEKAEDGPDGENRGQFSSPGAMLNQSFYKKSFEMTFTQEEIDLYRSYIKEIQWYDTYLIGEALKNSGPKLTPEGFQLVKQDRNDLLDKLYDAVGAPWYVRYSRNEYWK